MTEDDDIWIGYDDKLRNPRCGGKDIRVIWRIGIIKGNIYFYTKYFNIIHNLEFQNGQINQVINTNKLKVKPHPCSPRDFDVSLPKFYFVIPFASLFLYPTSHSYTHTPPTSTRRPPPPTRRWGRPCGLSHLFSSLRLCVLRASGSISPSFFCTPLHSYAPLSSSFLPQQRPASSTTFPPYRTFPLLVVDGLAPFSLSVKPLRPGDLPFANPLLPRTWTLTSLSLRIPSVSLICAFKC